MLTNLKKDFRGLIKFRQPIDSLELIRGLCEGGHSGY